MIALLALAWAGPVDLPHAAPTGARRALVIGVDDYAGDLSDLAHAGADAAAIGARLARGDAGFQVQALTGPVTRADARRALDATLAPDGGAEEDVVVVFFAGHATLDADGALWLLLADSDLRDLPGTALALGELQARASTGRPRRVALLIDACHDVASPTARTARSAAVAAPRLPRATGRDVFQGHAAEIGQRAWEDAALGHGLYTAALLDALDAPSSDWSLDGAIDAWEAHQVAQLDVRARSDGQQVPWYDQRRSGDDVIPLIGAPIAVPHAVLSPLAPGLQWSVDRAPRGPGPVAPGRHRLAVLRDPADGRALCRFSTTLAPGAQVPADPCAPSSLAPEVHLGVGATFIPGTGSLAGPALRAALGLWLPAPGAIRSRLGVTLDARAGGLADTYAARPLPSGAAGLLAGWSTGDVWELSLHAGPAVVWRRLTFEDQAAPAGLLRVGVGWRGDPLAVVLDGGLTITRMDGGPWWLGSLGLTVELRGALRRSSPAPARR